MFLWTKHCTEPGYGSLSIARSKHRISGVNMCVFRQSAAVDIVLRSRTGQVAQYFRLRYDTDKPSGGENTLVHISGRAEPDQFGTVMAKNFLWMIDEEDLMTPELERFAGGISLTDLKTINKGKRFVEFESVVVYSTIRYLIRDDGGISRDQLGRSVYHSGCTPK